MTRSDCLDGSKTCVCHNRDDQYGPPEKSFAEIAKLWEAYLDYPLDAHDVGIMMTLFKIARIKTGGRKDDNYIDAAGYIACACELSSVNETEAMSEVV